MFSVLSKNVIVLAVSLAFQCFVPLPAQEKYWIFFCDKGDRVFDPFTYFDVKAIERRQRLGLPLGEETDLPLKSEYLKVLEKHTGRIYTESRWLNAVTVKASDQQLAIIRELPFVIGTLPVAHAESVSFCSYQAGELSDDKLDLLIRQTGRMGAEIFGEHGVDGRGVRIAVFDGGFPGVDTHPCFDHLRREGRIIKTYDFVKNREDVYKGINHGSMVLSCIAGIYDGTKMGLATGSEFLLARTERRGELYSEEENWLAAVEWADKNGADIINSSLGYTYHRYFPVDMDGRTSLVARAANIAAKKGILVINAMGNDGDKLWEYLGTPADVDSVMSVAGINPETDYHISFSSYGPTADMRRKPNIAAYAEVIAAKKSKLARVQGTSFSTPLVTGFAACVMQMNPGLGNMEVFNLVEHSAHLFPYYDYAHGYGIPQAAYFFKDITGDSRDLFFEFVDDTIFIVIPEEINLNDSNSDNLLFFHLENEKGVLERYSVVNAYQHDVLKFLANGILDDKILRVHFRGTTIIHKF
ncbi:MAG: S8 family serine peptidase [Bacteroidales bacterium]|nr:S8 family serine peptidase [Bacteroidales bacterium]